MALTTIRPFGVGKLTTAVAAVRGTVRQAASGSAIGDLGDQLAIEHVEDDLGRALEVHLLHDAGAVGANRLRAQIQQPSRSPARPCRRRVAASVWYSRFDSISCGSCALRPRTRSSASSCASDGVRYFRPSVHLAHRRRQLPRRMVLREVSVGAGGQDAPGILLLGMDAEHEDLQPRPESP